MMTAINDDHYYQNDDNCHDTALPNYNAVESESGFGDYDNDYYYCDYDYSEEDKNAYNGGDRF